MVIYPQGSILNTTGQTHWNVGGWTIGSTTDDVDFIESLIDWFGANYNINLDWFELAPTAKNSWDVSGRVPGNLLPVFAKYLFSVEVKA